ncbi:MULTISPECIES: hypothetical protein [unclassified Sphingobacterium]|uniref:hypothetical protein n=1 Tax=unclassified Sphingobacterium TaxID=2609468 RepID=UPI0025CF1F77|nr:MULTISPECIES: hypothetical protein [unclassified Sphingobacterium]
MFNQLFENLFPLPETFRAKLFARFEQVEFKRGDYLIKAGDYSSNLFVIESGLIRQFYTIPIANCAGKVNYLSPGSSMVNIILLWNKSRKTR